jgi:hypothetical protein
MAVDGLSESEIAKRLGIDRRTAAKLVDADEPPGYRRAPAGSMLDPLELVLRRLLEEWPDIRAPRVTELLRDDYGYQGSVDLVRKRLAVLRPRPERAAQRTGCSGFGPRAASAIWASWMSSTPAGATRSRCRVATRRAGTSSPSAWRTSASNCGCCRRSPSIPRAVAHRGSRPTAI